MTLIIVHHHLRPGGIRRVIELAVPHLVRFAPQPVARVVLATGQRAERAWHDRFARQLQGVPVELRVVPAFNYLSEQRRSPPTIARMIHRALAELFGKVSGKPGAVVWAHNLGVGRNLLLARELGVVCEEHDVPLVSHHHDWWFDNRWARWPEIRRSGFHNLTDAAQAVFPETVPVLHAAINHADATILSRHLEQRAVWLPNIAESSPLPSPSRVRQAGCWLRNRLSCGDHPVWLLPCRTLRRKNIAEALLLARWLRPTAWLVVTGGASSAEEKPYFLALKHAAQKHRWRFTLGVLAGDETRKPEVSELLAASEAVLLTSIQEGFGLPYLEAAAAKRPLLARRLPNIAPDLNRFGFRFPHAYDEIQIAPELFDWHCERVRQERLFRAWCATMPGFARARMLQPPFLAAQTPCPIPFSRLTLTAQLEVLAHPAPESWTACLPLNPFLEKWRQRAGAGKLRVTPWPRTAKRWLGGQAYARRFFAALAPLSRSNRRRASSERIQADFITAKLDAQNLFPLLWSTNT